MKTKVKRMSKRTLAIFLGVVLIAMSTFIAFAWNTPIKIRSNVNNWGTQTMTSGSNNEWSYDYYFTHNQNYDLYFNFVDNNGNWVGPSDGANTYINTSHKNTKACSDSFKYQSSWLGGTTTWYKVTIQFKNVDNGEAWYWTSSLSSPSISCSLSTASKNATYNLGNYLSTSNFIGSATYTYSIKAPNNTITTNGANWTPTQTGTYQVTVNANDNGVIAGQNASAARTASQTFNITVEEEKYIYVDYSGTSWSNIYLYMWNGSNTSQNNDWPGRQAVNNNAATNTNFTVTKISDKLFKVSGIDMTTYNKIIIDNGASGTKNQTGDKDLANGKLYKVSVSGDNTDCQVTDYLAYYVSGDKGLVGTEWTRTPSTGLMSGPTSNVYSKTFSNIAAGTYEFRITSSDDSKFTSGWSSYSDLSSVTAIDTTGDISVSQSNTDDNNIKIVLPQKSNVTITYNSSTNAVTVQAEEIVTSGDWVAGDKYTSSGTNANQNVVDIPNIGSTSSTYKYVWANNDNGPGRSGTTAIDLVQNASSGNIGYWADITTQVKTCEYFYFALSSNQYNGGIRGNKSEKINCVTKAANDDVTIYNSSNQPVMTVKFQERSEVAGSAYYPCIYDVQWSKISAIGVMAYYSGSSVDYQFYFKEIGGGTSTVSTVDVYAKSGSLRNNYSTFGSIATSEIDNTSNTKVSSDYSLNENWNGGNIETASIKKGKTFRVKTTVNSANKNDYYVKGFDVNGTTYGLIEESDATSHKSDGVYTTDISIDVDSEDTKIEITPIFYKFDDSRTKFYIEGYDDVPETEGWGDTIYIYPFYGNVDGSSNAFKGYPGQPVINEGGKRYIDIPNSVTYNGSSVDIKGITMSNGYWDTAHRSLEGWTTSNANHKQTYDYDDFYKIKREAAVKNKTISSIIFYFKYKNGYNASRSSYQDAGGNVITSSFTHSSIDSTFKNGFEPLTNYYHEYVDVMGTKLTDQTEPTLSNAEILIVSNGYVNNIAGWFGTEWTVYTKSGSTWNKQQTLSPSALAMASASSFDNYSGTKWSNYKTAYQALDTDTFKQKKTMITYENALFGGKKPDGGYDEAVRNDGRWYVTYTDETINANIKIQYTGGGVSDWTDDTFVNTNEGSVTNAKAFFTNTSVVNGNGNTISLNNQVTASNIRINDAQKFTFKADNTSLNPSYKFVGWYRQNGKSVSEISKSATASSSMSATDTYIARYRYTGAATIRINHSLLPTSALGTTEISAVRTKDDDTTVSYTNANAVNGTLTIPVASTDKKVEVTLKGVSIGENQFKGFYNGTTESDLIANTRTDAVTGSGGETKTITINQSDIFNSNDSPKKENFYYYSNFNNVTQKISVVYTYTDRFGATKKHRAEKELDARYLESYKTNTTPKRYDLNTNTILNDTSGNGTYTITQWIQDFAPQIDDLDKNATWNLSNITHTSGEQTFYLTATQTTKQHKVYFKFKQNNQNVTIPTQTVDEDAFTKTVANGGMMGGTYNDDSSSFKYWAVWGLKVNDGEPEKSGDKEYARCYNRYFSLTIPEDSYIEAVYEYPTGETNGDIAAIREPIFTREISNADSNGNFVTDNGKVVTLDYLYADFVVSYMTENYSVQFNTGTDTTKYNTGVIMEFNQNVTIDDSIASTITDKKFDSTTDTIKSNLNTFLSAGGFGTNNAKNYTTYNAPTTGPNASSGKNAMYYYSIDNSTYNDFNRLDYFLRFNNTNTWRKRVMKAYYYVKNTATNEITLSEPVYFALNVIGNSEANIVGANS